jgi:hypothetical protein
MILLFLVSFKVIYGYFRVTISKGKVKNILLQEPHNLAELHGISKKILLSKEDIVIQKRIG